MQRAYGANVQGTAPAMPGSLQVGYVKDTGGATTPGYWWYHMVTESLMNLLSAASITPSASDMTQITQAVISLAKANTLTGAMKPVRVIDTTPSVSYSGLQVIDGVTLVNGDRVLRNYASSTPINNGIYIVNSGGAWPRAADMATGATIPEATMVSVSEGSAGNIGTIWTINAVSGEIVTVNTTAFTFNNITASTQAMFASYLPTATAASTYLTQSGASSTYQTISGMSSYLTTATAVSTYLKITDASTTYQTQSGMSSYATVASLSAYVTNTTLTSNYYTGSTISGNYLSIANASATYQTITGMSSYVTNASLSSTLGSYATVASLSSYVTNSSLTSTLSSYVTNSSLTSTLSSYVTSSSLTTTLGSYLTTASASSTYQPLSGMSSYLTVATASSTYATQSYVTGNPQMNSLGVGTPADGTAGDIRATGTITGSYSDDRLKDRIETLNPARALEIVDQMDVFFYTPNEYAQSLGRPMKRELGMSAQQHIELGLAEVVAESGLQHSPERRDETPLLTLRYERDVALLVAAVQGLRSELHERDKLIHDQGQKLLAQGEQIERLIQSARRAPGNLGR